MSRTTRWLKDQGYWDVPKGAPCTHVFLNGGKAFVPVEEHDHLFELYARDIAEGVPMYMVERTYRDGTSRMSADLDYKLSGTEGDDIQRIMMEILNIALDNLPDVMRDGGVVVCVRDATKNKIGIHLIWQSLRVNNEVARGLRDAWLDRISKCSCESPDWDWGTIIDESVYKNSGMRSVYSQKRGDPDNVYIPTHIYDTRDKTFAPVPCTHSFLDLIKIASIMASPCDDVDDALKAYRSPPQSKSVKNLPKANVSDSTLDKLRGLLPDHYKNDRLGQSCQSRKSGLLVSSSSRYCSIAGREHRSNHIYFEIDKAGGVKQFCHSEHCKNKSHVITESTKSKLRRSMNTPSSAAAFWLDRVKQL